MPAKHDDDQPGLALHNYGEDNPKHDHAPGTTYVNCPTCIYINDHLADYYHDKHGWHKHGQHDVADDHSCLLCLNPYDAADYPGHNYGADNPKHDHAPGVTADNCPTCIYLDAHAAAYRR